MKFGHRTLASSGSCWHRCCRALGALLIFIVIGAARLLPGPRSRGDLH